MVVKNCLTIFFTLTFIASACINADKAKNAHSDRKLIVKQIETSKKVVVSKDSFSMGFFDFFKKKEQENNSDNVLEGLLQRAATDPGVRADFYRKLLTEKLVVITRNDNFKSGAETLKHGMTVNIFSFDDGKIPVFTSKDRIFDKGIVKEQVQVLEVNGRDLFDFLKGATVILNPYSDYGKELLPDEITSLLSGTIYHAMDQTIKITEATQVQIGQPSVYPNEIVGALIPILAGAANVKAAYVAWIYIPDSGQPAHYLFGIDANGEIQEVSSKCGQAAKTFLKSGEFVDFIKIEGNTLGGYFKKIEPFYAK
ncbi:MAG: hypothetical protein K0Q79_3338 [Flavipsychrobacter sp.]|jgi:hypothetical protein|nr:hypothetical protein [Flavipsychrobacter sp.]